MKEDPDRLYEVRLALVKLEECDMDVLLRIYLKL